MITQVDPVWAHCDEPEKLKPFLSFPKEFWKKSGYKKERKIYTKTLIKNGFFLSGFASRMSREMGIEYKYSKSFNTTLPKLPGIELRSDQKKLIASAVEKERGVLVSPTGSGKTVIAGAIISCYPKETKILFLCHTISLLTQTKIEFEKWGFGKISCVGEGEKDLSGRIVVSTIQSFSKLDIDERDVFDIIIIDECHHCSSENSLYYNTLISMTATIRIGVTATLPTNQENKLIMEGLLGEVIAETTLQEGADLNFLSIPKIKLIRTEKIDIKDLYKYPDIYDEVIVTNRARNRLIINEIKSQNQMGRTTLTYVSKIEHGKSLLTLAENQNISIHFIQGATNGEQRESLRNALQSKKIMNVIATTVWKEGINIPSLNCIVIAGGGKSELSLLQTVGRGLRRDNEKNEILIIDFVDSAKYVSEHCCERINIYLEKGWEITKGD